MLSTRIWSFFLVVLLLTPTIGCQFVREQQKERTVFVRMATANNRPTAVENPNGEPAEFSQLQYEGDSYVFILTKRW